MTWLGATRPPPDQATLAAFHEWNMTALTDYSAPDGAYGTFRARRAPAKVPPRSPTRSGRAAAEAIDRSFTHHLP